MGVEIGQLEFRWTGDGQRGFSVVAWSNQLDSALWGRRLRHLARPPAMQYPTTLIYQTFGNEAAIVFRHIIRSNALAVLDPERTEVNREAGLPEPERAALVARALVGPVKLLGPDLALACAAVVLPQFFDPPLGKALEGEQLPALLAGNLGMEAQTGHLCAQLDATAREDPALPYLVAAVLERPATPLALQVPEAEIGKNSTASLLWGLWRITYPIFGNTRDWTFSTGEPPPGNTDPGPLPQLVVRSLPRPGDSRPTAQREEMVIQPRATGTEPDRYAAGPMAELLVTAYRRLSVQAFLDHVQEGNAAGGTLADRLAAIADRLQAFQNPRQGQLPVREWEPDQDQDQYQDQAHSAFPSRPEPTAAQHAVPRFQPAAKRHQVPTTLGEDAVGRVLNRLAAGEITATDDLIEMRTQVAPPGGERRAFLRREATRHGWFVRQFSRQYPRDVEGSLRALFMLIVEPDMDDAARRPQLRDELTSWMKDERTPDVVLLALESLFWDRRDFEFRQRLLGVVGSRWLADHGRYGQLMEPAQPTRAAQHSIPRARWWVPIRREHVPARLANIGVYVVLAEAIIIALLAAGWL